MKNNERRRPRWQDIDGVLLLDKAVGVSSNHALQAVRRLYQAKKAGHTGSLDPLASGLLPICFGEATKFSQYLLDADKTYQVTAQLGITTDSGDSEGMVIRREAQMAQAIDLEVLKQHLSHFQGTQAQLPPMYSALKHQGRPLYHYARQGKVIPRTPRQITIYELTLLEFKPPQFQLQVVCSKGTYIRTLVEDIGHALGVGACVTALRRTRVGDYTLNPDLTAAALEPLAASERLTLLKPVDDCLRRFSEVWLTEAEAVAVQQGKKIRPEHAPALRGPLRAYDVQGSFIGLVTTDEAGKIKAVRLLKQSERAEE